MKIQHPQLSSFKLFLLVIHHSDLKKKNLTRIFNYKCSFYVSTERYILGFCFIYFKIFIMRNYRQSQGSAEPCMLSPSYDECAASTVLMKDPYKLSSLGPLASTLSKLALTTKLFPFVFPFIIGGDLCPAPSILL